jgi:hypothetical protein
MRTAFVLLLAVFANRGRLVADEPTFGIQLPKGTWAVSVKIAEIDVGATELTAIANALGKEVDVFGEVSGPLQTGIVLVNVKLLALDSVPIGKKFDRVLVALTPAQVEVLQLMQKHGMKLVIKVHEKEKPKP